MYGLWHRLCENGQRHIPDAEVETTDDTPHGIAVYKDSGKAVRLTTSRKLYIVQPNVLCLRRHSPRPRRSILPILKNIGTAGSFRGRDISRAGGVLPDAEEERRTDGERWSVGSGQGHEARI